MKLIFLGPPGAGKGTIAKKVCDKLNIIQISTGDLFRAAVKNETPLGLKVKDLMASGALIPDAVTIDLVKERLAEKDCQNGYILDGFPRTIPQAEALAGFAAVDAVINFKIDDEQVIIKRLTGRLVCRACGAIFHQVNNPPAKKGICDKCGGEIYTRDDDKIESVKHRLDVYTEQTEPLIKYYGKTGLLKDIKSDQAADKVEESLLSVLDGMK